MELIVQPKVTYILFEDDLPRRIYTDGRSWPAEPEPSFAGYSIGHWVDEAGEGRFNMLEIETRYMKGPRTFEVSGLPLHEDNQTVVKERIFLDKAKPDLLYDEITTIDHALTRPWDGDQELPGGKWIITRLDVADKIGQPSGGAEHRLGE